MNKREKSERELLHEILFFLLEKKIFCFENTQAGFYDGKNFRPHTSPFFKRGVSDILGVFKGRFLAIEVKREKELNWYRNFCLRNKFCEGVSLSTQKKFFHFREQEKFLEDVKKNGGVAFFAFSVDCVRRNLNL